MTLFEDGGPQDSLEKAKRLVRNGRPEGVFCPCCGLFNKEYPRKLNSGMAFALIWLVRQYCRKREWIFVNKRAPRYILRRGGEWTLLKHWDLIEEKPSDPDADERTSGLWRPTEYGINFVYRRSSVISHVVTFNHECIDLRGETVGIVECLGKHFSYQELMATP